ncbi:hypothetical protein [Mycolicibacterium vanbaalenii]|uniref:hypothetical protein n=1 Tax=Mycolicibacterium vanbaalenii TaxID=110539 RepID=UPI0021F32B94|nr:hypothetical protein [Mycolicibacterium vanbaalenii]
MTAMVELSAPARSAHCTNPVGRHRSTRPRTFNIVDLENLVGGRVSSSAVREVWSEFGEIIDTCYTDLTTVAVSRQHAATAFLALPANLHRVIGANGPDAPTSL